jgi:WD40 repeat protein
MSRCAVLFTVLITSPVLAWQSEDPQAELARQRAEVLRLGRLLDITTYRHRLELARREWADGNVIRAQVLLDECPDGQRGFEWRLLDEMVRGARVTGVEAASVGRGLGFLAGDATVILSGTGGEPVLWDVGAGQERLFAVPGRPGGKNLASSGPVALSADGSLLALTDGATVRLVKPTGEEGRTFTAPAVPVTDLTFSRDGRRLAVVAREAVVVWDVESGAEVFAMSLRPRSGAAVCLDLGPRGDLLAVGLAAGSVQMWNVDEGSLAMKLPLAGVPSRVRFHPEGTRLAVVAGDRLRLWELTSRGAVAVAPEGDPAAVATVAWSPDATRLAAGVGPDVVVWDRSGQHRLETHRGHAARVRHVAFSTDSRRLASLSEDRVLKVRDVLGGAGGTFAAHRSRVTGVAWSPDGAFVASASADHTVQVWEAGTRRKVVSLGTHPGTVTCLAYAPDGKQIATGCVDGVVRTWDAVTGRPIENLAGFKETITAVAYSPDGKFLAAASTEGLLQVQTRADSKVRPAKLPGPGAFGLAFTPDGTRLAVGCSDLTDVAVRVFDPGTLREVEQFRGPRAQPTLAWSPDGTTLAFGSSTGTRLVSRDRSAAERVLRDAAGTFDQATALAFSPDGQRVVTTGPGRPVRGWEATTGLELLTLPENLAGEVVAFSPDGARLVVGDGAGLVRILEAPVRSGPRTFVDSAYHLAFSPDGRWMLTGLRQPEHLLVLRDLKTGSQGAVLDTLGGGLLSQQVYFSPDSKTVRTLQEQREGGKSRFLVRSWDVAKGHETERKAIEPTGQVVHWHWIGTHVAVASTTEKGHAVQVWDALTGKPIQTLADVGAGVTSIRLSPDGAWLLVSTLASGSGQGTVTAVWDVGVGRKTVPALESGLSTGTSLARLAFVPGGRLLAGCAKASDGTVSLVLLDAGTGQLVRRVPIERGGPLAISPDGEHVAHLDGAIVRVYPTGGGDPIALPASPHMPFQGDHLAFTPDGKHLAIQGGLAHASRVYLWDFRGGRSLVLKPDPQREIVAACVDHRDAANAALRDRHWYAACFHLDRLILHQPDMPELYRLRGQALVGLQDHPRAVPDLARALNGNVVGVGQGLRAEDWKALQPIVAGALLKAPESWPLLALQGHAFAGQGQWDGAVKSFSRAVKDGGNKPVVVERFAFAALGAQDTLLYKKIAEQMLRDFAEPKDATTANNIAWACLVGSGGNPESALGLAQRAVEVAAFAPGETRHAYLNTLALGLYRTGNAVEAERMVRAAIEVNGDVASRLDHALLALCHAQLGKKEVAKVDLAEALRGSEDDPVLRGSWEARVELGQLRAEVEALLGK